MVQQNQYDVIIIGSGAGGGTLAYKLAPSGKRILILERGEYLAREKENWASREVFVNGRYNNAENWLDNKGKEFQPGQHYFVGGNTKFYGAVLLRMRRKDFGELQHHGGISPAWPLTYDDFEPYYTQAEQLYQVHGVTGGTDAQAEVTVRLEENGRTVNGQGADTDTLVASARAYVNALNKLVVQREKSVSALSA